MDWTLRGGVCEEVEISLCVNCSLERAIKYFIDFNNLAIVFDIFSVSPNKNPPN